MNIENYDEILKALGQREFPAWHPIMKGGKPLYDLLLRELEASPNPFSERQIINVMLVLVRLRHWGDTQKVIQVIGKYVESSSIKVRSEAARFLAGFVTLSRDPSHKNEKINITSIPPLLERAKSRGLTKRVSDLVNTVI